MIERNFLKKLDYSLNNFPILGLIGARQVGKSTFAKSLRPTWRYIDLEVPDNALFARQSPSLFLEQLGSQVILDEIQHVPELFEVLRGLVDKDRESNNRFIILGSSSPELLSRASESLAGRISIFEVPSLKINVSDIARSLSVSEGTIRNYLEIVNGTYIWRKIPSYQRSTMRSIMKMPKGIIRDVGLARHLCFVSSVEQLHQSPKLGNLFESFVIEELVKGFEIVSNFQLQYSHYRTRAGVEVDFIIEGPFGVIPIEIKFGKFSKLKDLKGLLSFLEKEEAKFGVVINNSESPALIHEKIIQIPVGCI